MKKTPQKRRTKKTKKNEPSPFLTPERKKAWLLLAGIFVTSRVVAWLAGVRFLDDVIHYAAQIPDPYLLKDRFWETLFYTHTHPPIFTIFIGLGLKLFGFKIAPYFFKIPYLVLGLVMTLSFFELSVRLGVRRWIGILGACLLCLSPATILYENLLLYTYWEFSLLFLTSFALIHFLDRPNTIRGSLFFGTMVFLILTRRSFNIDWFVITAIVTGFFVWKRIPTKTYLKLVAVSILFILLPYFKNLAAHGIFSPSTFAGMSTTKLMLENVPIEKRNLLLEEKKVSDLVYYYAFMDLPYYPQNYTHIEDTGIPILDNIYKKGGYTNFDNKAYIQLSKHYLPISLEALKNFPYYYARGVFASFWLYYLKPASSAYEIRTNRSAISTWDSFFNKYIYGCVAGRDQQIVGCAGLILSFFFLPLASLGLIVYLWTRKKRNEATVILYVLGNIVYFTILSIVIECCELYRLRFNLEPFFWLLFALILNAGVDLKNYLVKDLKNARKQKS